MAVRIAINDESLKGPLAWSVLCHVLLVASLTVSTFFSDRGEFWGGSGQGAVSVRLVGGVAGVPLPRPEAVTTSRVVDPTKGLYREEPPTKQPEPPVAEKQIPEFTKQKQPRYVSRPSRVLEDPTPPPSNAVPYGQGGSPSMPYSDFTLGGAGSNTTGGMGFEGPGGGDFGARFSWYVDAVRNRISSNWLYSTVDSSVRWAPRAVLTFDILRNGSVTNVQILRSSGNPSVDNSAVRAILSSNPVNPLPNEYAGQRVSVEFWFEFRR
jgi:protein TonB